MCPVPADNGNTVEKTAEYYKEGDQMAAFVEEEPFLMNDYLPTVPSAAAPLSTLMSCRSSLLLSPTALYCCGLA